MSSEKAPKSYILKGNQRSQVYKYPPSFFEQMRSIDRKLHRSKVEEELRQERVEATRLKEQDSFVQENIDLLFVRLFMSLS